MTPPNIEQTFQVSVAEHQVLLSFQNDEDAIKFNEWWSNEGEQVFLDVAENY